jgi:tryptophan halogenase
MEIPSTLRSRIALFEHEASAYQDSHDLFRVDSWVQVMLGQRIEPRSYHPAAELIPPERLRASLAELQRGIAAQVQAMPSHETWLQRFGSELRAADASESTGTLAAE